MRVAVTGAAGYIGGWLCVALHLAGHEVHAQDLYKPNVLGPEPWASFRLFDLGSQERIAWLGAVRPDVVIHLAALYGRVWGEVDMMRTAAMNSGLAGEVARDTAAAGARLMYMSSSEVYGE